MQEAVDYLNKESRFLSFSVLLSSSDFAVSKLRASIKLCICCSLLKLKQTCDTKKVSLIGYIGIFVCLFGETIHGHGVLPSSHGIVCYHRIA